MTYFKQALNAPPEAEREHEQQSEHDDCGAADALRRHASRQAGGSTSPAAAVHCVSVSAV
jgi:hypothetical protein